MYDKYILILIKYNNEYFRNIKYKNKFHSIFLSTVV